MPRNPGEGPRARSKAPETVESEPTALAAAFAEAQEKKNGARDAKEKKAPPKKTEKKVAAKKAAPQKTPKPVEKPGFYSGGYYSPGTPAQESRLPRDVVKGFDGAPDPALDDLTDKYLRHAETEMTEAFKGTIQEHERAMGMLVEEQLADIDAERKAPALEKLRKAAEERKKEGEELAEEQRWRTYIERYRTTARTTMNREEKMSAIRNAESFERLLAAREAARNAKNEPAAPEPAPEAVAEVPTEAPAAPAAPEAEAKDEFEELRKEHALAETEPNSRAERRAKMEALLEKYGPRARAAASAAETTSPAPASTAQEEAVEAKAEIPTTISKEQMEEAFRIYQGGEMFETRTEASKPTPEISKEQMEEAFRIYQAGDRGVAPVAPGAVTAASLAEKHSKKTKSNAEFVEAGKDFAVKEKYAQDLYFNMLRRHQKNRGFFDALGERMGLKKGSEKGTSSELRLLRQGWVEARANRARLMLDSIDARREGRGGAARQGRDIEKVRERYQRMYVVKEAVLGAEEAEQKVRSEALKGRDRNIVEAAWKKYQSLPAAMKAAPLALGAGIAFGMGATIPAAALLGLGGVSAGFNIAAERARKGNHEKTANVLSGIAKIFTFGGWGGVGGRMLARNRNKKTLAGAEGTLKKQEKYADLRGADAFAALSRQRQEAAASKSMVDNRVATAGAVGAVAASAAGGALVGAAFGHHGAPGQETGAGNGEHHAGGGTVSNSARVEHAAGGGSPSGLHEAAPAQSLDDPIARAHGGFTAEIKTNGEGADLLYKDLRGQLAEAYKGHTPPPIVEKLLSFKSLDQLSHETGFENFPNSAVMHMGDKFVVSPDGHTLSFVNVRDPGTMHVLMQETSQHIAVPVSQQEGWIPMRDYTHSTGVEQTANAGRDSSGNDSVANLNKAQVSASAASPEAPASSAQMPRTVPLDDIIDSRQV